MRQTVTVTAVSGQYAMVAYDRPTACHGDCSQCAGGCGSMAARERVTVQARNTIGAAPGDRVVIDAAAKQVFSAILLVYALPVVLFFLGYALGEALWAAGVAAGVLGFFLGVLVAVLVSRRKTRTGREIQFAIVSFAD